MEAPDADWIRNDDDGQQEQEVDRAEPVITLRVDAARIMVLEPVDADHDIAENQCKKIPRGINDLKLRTAWTAPDRTKGWSSLSSFLMSTSGFWCFRKPKRLVQLPLPTDAGVAEWQTLWT